MKIGWQKIILIRIKSIKNSKEGYMMKDNKIQIRNSTTDFLVFTKQAGEEGIFDEEYFEHLLDKIREIRASERKFYQKITDIYMTAVDYLIAAFVKRRNAGFEPVRFYVFGLCGTSGKTKNSNDNGRLG